MTESISTTVDRERARWQFSLRALFVLTLSAAALAAIGRVAAQLDLFVLGVAAAIWSTRGAVRSWRTRQRLRLLSWLTTAASWFVFYVVSVGPSILVAERIVSTTAPLKTFYAPLVWLYDHTPLHDALAWYTDFWISME